MKKFDKKNALEFADKIFTSDKKYMKLCRGFLDIGRNSCILGEIRDRFLPRDFANKTLPTVIATLCEQALTDKKDELWVALNALVVANDATHIDSYDYLNRAKIVKETWIKNVVPLLKWSL